METEINETWCYEMLRKVRWPKGIICPLCVGKRVTTHSKFASTSRRRYLCLSCRRTFTDLTGTPFARTNLPLGIWLICLDLIGSGLTTSEIAKELGVKWDTADHMQRRLATAQGRLIPQLSQAAKEARYG